MKRTILLVLTVLLNTWVAVAQEPARTPSAEKAGTPVVQFVLDWPAQNPPRYTVAVDAAGRATYKSEPGADPSGGAAPEPYLVEWTATETTRSKIFDAVKKLNYLQGNFESKAKVALTGAKTLSYKDVSHNTSTSYNYSENPLIRELTHIFQSISTTAEFGRKLEYDVRFDKLGVDAQLKALQEQQRQGDAIELASIARVLQQIAGDSSMFRMSQQRAKEILRTAGLSSSAPPTQATEGQ